MQDEPYIPMATELGWYWLSFADPNLPKGSQWLGATVECGSSSQAAYFAATMAKRNPGGEVQIMGPIPDETIDEFCPPEARQRLITDRAELERAVGPTTSEADAASSVGSTS